MKDIAGFEGQYAITTDGRVWSYPNHLHDGRWMSAPLNWYGYPTVCIRKGGRRYYFSVHRLRRGLKLRRLTDDHVREIRYLLLDAERTQESIARRFGVSRKSIHHICNGVTYLHTREQLL